MRWLITGGCGFIGTSIIRALCEEGRHHIRIIDNLYTGTRSDLSGVCTYRELAPDAISKTFEGCELIVGNVLDEDLAKAVVQGVDVIVHLAANTGVGPSVENPRNDCLTNVLGTFNYLEAARLGGIPRFVFASSGAPAGEVEPPIHEELPPHPVSPYGASKLAGEGYCSAYKRSFGVDTVALRFGNVYGPGSAHKGSVVAKFIRQALRGEKLEIFGDGGQTRDFIYIDDLVKAVKLASSVPDIGGEIFQIATNHETTISELTEKLLTALRDRGVNNVEISNSCARIGDVRRNFSDTSKAKSLLGWTAETGLETGLGLTVGYFLEQCESE